MDYYENRNYYEILGVKEDASLISIQNAKDRLKFGDSDDRVPFSMWDKIDEAYSVLSDINKRKEYDEKLEVIRNKNINLKNNFTHIEQVKEENEIDNMIQFDNAFVELPKNEKEDTTEFDNTFVELPKNEMVDITKYDNLFQEITKKKDMSNSYEKNQDPIIKQSFFNKPELNQNQTQDSVVPKLKRIGKEFILALPTGVIATVDIIKKLKNKYTLEHDNDNSEKEICEVKTEDSILLEEYRQRLDRNIDQLLEEPHNNYKLQIDRLRYENSIELLQKRIEQKENEVVKKWHLTRYKLQLTALRKQLQTYKEHLEIVEEKIKNYQGSNSLKNIHENLYDVKNKLDENDRSSNKKVFLAKKLKIKEEQLLKLKKAKIQKLKSRRELYAIFKDSFVTSHAITENFVDNIFIPADKIEERERVRAH